MDLSCFIDAGAHAIDEQAVPPDYAMLVATLAAMQSASAAARAASLAPPPAPANMSGDRPLVEILLGTASWRACVDVQGGCFNKDVGRARRKGKSP